MKKLLFILAAVVLAVGCTDKPEYKAPGSDVPQSVTLTYDTAQITSADSQFEQSLNRVDDIYRVGGKYVKLTVFLNNDGVYYITASSLTEDDIEAIAEGEMFDCEIAKVEGNFSNPTQVNIATDVLDDDFFPMSDLPEATELQEPTADQPESVNVYKLDAESHPAYVVRYKTEVDGEEVVEFGFVFVVNDITMTETTSQVVIPHPYEEITEDVVNYQTSVTLLYKSFDKNGKWVN